MFGFLSSLLRSTAQQAEPFYIYGDHRNLRDFNDNYTVQRHHMLPTPPCDLPYEAYNALGYSIMLYNVPPCSRMSHRALVLIHGLYRARVLCGKYHVLMFAGAIPGLLLEDYHPATWVLI